MTGLLRPEGQRARRGHAAEQAQGRPQRPVHRLCCALLWRNTRRQFSSDQPPEVGNPRRPPGAEHQVPIRQEHRVMRVVKPIHAQQVGDVEGGDLPPTISLAS